MASRKYLENPLIMEALDALYEEESGGAPFYMRRIQWKSYGLHGYNKGIYWTERMQKRCFALQEQGKILFLRKGRRYFVCRAGDEIPDGFVLLKRCDIPDYRYKMRVEFFDSVVRNPILRKDVKLFSEYWLIKFSIVNIRESSWFFLERGLTRCMDEHITEFLDGYRYLFRHPDGVYLGNDRFIFRSLCFAIRKQETIELG